MNWGKGIIAVLALFILFISGMSIYMFMAPVDDYDHQYYEKGLTFNHDYDREKQVVKDHARPLIAIINHHINITFAQPVLGKIKFMRPSDNTLDKVFNLNSGVGKYVDLSLATIVGGEWQLEMEWESNHKAYLYHQEVFIK
jgi:hypothetical protein